MSSLAKNQSSMFDVSGNFMSTIKSKEDEMLKI